MTVLLVVASYSLALAPLADFRAGGFPTVLAYMISSLLWGGTIAGYILFGIASKQRKQLQTKKQKRKSTQRPGIIVFCSSVPATVVDTVMAVSFVFTVFCLITGSLIPQPVQFISIATLIFTAQFHALINGVNFRSAFRFRPHQRGKQKKEEQKDDSDKEE